MAATTITALTDAQVKLLQDFDPANAEVSLGDKLQAIITTLNAHAAEIDLKADA